MTGEVPIKDLVILVADLDIEFALRGVLARPDDLGICDGISFDIYRHVYHDSGCFKDSEHFLRQFLQSHRFALVVFDREGCGQERLDRRALESQVEDRLGRNGWQGRSAAVAIDPELEAWVWAQGPRVEEVLGWSRRTPGLGRWLRDAGFLNAERQVKPDRPKEALRAALRQAGTPVSASLFQQLAQSVCFDACRDEAFAKLRATLRDWFEPAGASETARNETSAGEQCGDPASSSVKEPHRGRRSRRGRSTGVREPAMGPYFGGGQE